LLNNKQFLDKKVIVAPPPIGKDYADTLKAIQQLHMEKSQTAYRQNEGVL
jgi:hypothetical protein